MMQRALLAALALATVFATTAFAFNPDQLNRLTFDNTTGANIETIFLSPSDSKFWGPDIIGGDYILKNEASVSYYMHCPGRSCTFDILATDDRGNKIEIRDFEMIDGKEARVVLTAGEGITKAPDITLVSVRFDNNTGHEIQYLFVSPADSQAWGADLLDAETTLAHGDSCSFVFLAGKGSVSFKLMAVDESNSEYQFTMTVDPKTRKEFRWAIEPADLKKAK